MRSHYLYFVAFSGLCTARPVDDGGFISQFPVHSTEGSDGSVVDWVPVNSQVDEEEIASAPELPDLSALQISTLASNDSTLRPEPVTAAEHQGPEGTVPIVRQYGRLPDVKGPPQTMEQEQSNQTHVKKRAAGDHWYASSAQNVANHGGSATYSLYKAYTESGADFSLLQSAVIRYNVKSPLDSSRSVMQTVEAGWINYPNQISDPHLFVYYTTNGYATSANNQGGWNRDVTGWVQVDPAIYPGVTFSPLSTRGGAQYDMKIQWRLWEGNWWLFVLDRWIGYYPASLFGANTDAQKSLQTGADAINFYGEIYDSHEALTKTDMGSGSFPDKGYGQSAYIRNMVYTDTSGNDKKYDGSSGLVISDSNRYQMRADWSGTGSWGSYMYLGGPGAGGAIGS